MQFEFTQILFLLASFIAAIGLIFIIYSRSSSAITSRLFILTLVLVIAYLISHTLHFVFMPSADLTALDISCHSLLLMVLVSLTFFTWNYPVQQKIGLTRGLLIIIPSTLLLFLLWNGEFVHESYSHMDMFSAKFTSLYPLFLFWYLFLIVLNSFLIVKKIINTTDNNIRKQLMFYLFGLIITNLATFIFGLFLPWILGFYYLVEISPFAFLVGFIFFTSIAIGKYNMFPSMAQKVQGFSLNKKIIFSAIVIVPIIILLLQIPLGRFLFSINSSYEIIRFFFISMFVGLVVSISMSFIIFRIIAHPISILKEKAIEIAKGNYDLKIAYNSNDEIGELSQAFNHMTVSLYKNNTELKIREERISVLLNAFEKSLAAIAIVDLEYKIIEANQQFFDIIRKDKSDTEYRTIDSLQFHNSTNLFKKIMGEVNSKSVYTGEILLNSEKSENDRYLLISVTEIMSSQSIPIGYMFVEIDITDKKKLEAEIVRSEKFAALGKMSAVLAHEIKTPLTSIKLNVDILQQMLPLQPEDKEAFQIIGKEVNRLTDLVKEVLQISRTAPLHYTKINLRHFIDVIYHQIEIDTKKKEISFINNTASIDLMGDEDKLKQVFLNLVQNSVDAIDKSGIISCDSEIRGDLISIQLKDNGCGITETQNIFDPFFTTKTSGTGLGLSISQRIIEQHSGTLTIISSRPGETIFEIKLTLDNYGKNISN